MIKLTNYVRNCCHKSGHHQQAATHQAKFVRVYIRHPNGTLNRYKTMRTARDERYIFLLYVGWFDFETK